MKFLHLSFFIISFAICALTCKTVNFKPDFEIAGGFVLGKEECNTDTTRDYWLVDLSIFSSPNPYGDSLIINGFSYKHVVKTIDLAPQFKYFGAKVSFDFHLSSTIVQTTNCTVTMPVTYLLEEMQVLRQSEIR